MPHGHVGPSARLHFAGCRLDRRGEAFRLEAADGAGFLARLDIDDAGNEGTFSGATPFPLETVDSENFIAYEDLTSETILGWIQDVVVGDYEEHVNGQIAKMIDATVSPETEDNEADFPWTTSTETEEPAA